VFLILTGFTLPIDSRAQLRATLGATGKSPKELPPMALTDTKVKNAKPGLKTIRLFDEKGLYLPANINKAKQYTGKSIGEILGMESVKPMP